MLQSYTSPTPMYIRRQVTISSENIDMLGRGVCQRDKSGNSKASMAITGWGRGGRGCEAICHCLVLTDKSSLSWASHETCY